MEDISDNILQAAINYPLDESQADEIFYLVNVESLQEYIDGYSGKELTEEWVRRKGNESFWKGLDSNKGEGMFTDMLTITPLPKDDGSYRCNYFSVELTNAADFLKLSSACDRISDRRFLPNNSRSFNDDGTFTSEFCNLITSMAAVKMREHGLI